MTAPGARALLRRELLDRRRAPLTWGVPVGLLCALTAAIYPSIQEPLSRAVEGYPEALKQAFGVGELGTVEAYLSAEAFNLIVPISAAFFAIRSVSRAVPGAEEGGYLSVLLSAPVSRQVLVAAAFVSTAVMLFAVLAVVGAFTWIAASLAGAGLPLGHAAAGALGVWPLAMFFGGLAVLASGLAGRSSLVTEVAAGGLATMYVLDLLGKLSEDWEALRYVSVFKYYGAAIEDGIDPLAFLGVTAASVVLAVAGAYAFARRDLSG